MKTRVAVGIGAAAALVVVAIALWMRGEDAATSTTTASNAERDAEPHARRGSASEAASERAPDRPSARASTHAPQPARERAPRADLPAPAADAPSNAQNAARSTGQGAATENDEPNDDTPEDAGPRPRYPVTSTGIQQAIRSELPAIRDCYQSWVELQPNLRGKIVLNFHIVRDEKDPQRGVISQIKLRSTEMNHELLEGCVMNAVEGVEFQDPPIEGLEVNYPLMFDNIDAG